MKVKDLIKKLQTVDPELEVVMSKDGEGNSHSPFSDFSGGIYEAESTWSGYFTTWIYGEDEDGFDTERAAQPDEWNAICLWPVN